MTWTPERRLALARLLADGLSYGAAAKRLGVARGSVCWATARFGIGRAPADVSRKSPRPSRATGKRFDRWDEAALTERWADRRKSPAPQSPHLQRQPQELAA